MHYSVTELEMTGLLVNMGLWKSIICHHKFDAAVDHAVVAQILKAKAGPATTCIKNLLERLATYSFNLYYVKGKDMILADYLSRHRLWDSDPNELIPISFHITCPIGPAPVKLSLFPIQTCHSTRAAGEAPPPVHGAHKGLDPHKKPEHQRPSTLKEVPPPIPHPTGTPRTKITACKLLECSKNVQCQRPRPVETVGSPPPIPLAEGIQTAPHRQVAPCPPRPLPLPPMPQWP